MSMPRVTPKEFHQLHVAIPLDLWEEFKEVVPEYGVTSVIVKRLIRSYINTAKNNQTTIDMKSLIL